MRAGAEKWALELSRSHTCTSQDTLDAIQHAAPLHLTMWNSDYALFTMFSTHGALIGTKGDRTTRFSHKGVSLGL